MASSDPSNWNSHIDPDFSPDGSMPMSKTIPIFLAAMEKYGCGKDKSILEQLSMYYDGKILTDKSSDLDFSFGNIISTGKGTEFMELFSSTEVVSTKLSTWNENMDIDQLEKQLSQLGLCAV